MAALSALAVAAKKQKTEQEQAERRNIPFEQSDKKSPGAQMLTHVSGDGAFRVLVEIVHGEAPIQ